MHTYNVYNNVNKALVFDGFYGPIPRVGECLSYDGILYVVVQVLYHYDEGIWVYVEDKVSYVTKHNNAKSSRM